MNRAVGWPPGGRACPSTASPPTALSSLGKLQMSEQEAVAIAVVRLLTGITLEEFLRRANKNHSAGLFARDDYIQFCLVYAGALQMSGPFYVERHGPVIEGTQLNSMTAQWMIFRGPVVNDLSVIIGCAKVVGEHSGLLRPLFLGGKVAYRALWKIYHP